MLYSNARYYTLEQEASLDGMSNEENGKKLGIVLWIVSEQ